MKQTMRYCIVLTLICAVSAGLLAFVDQKTQAPIAAVNNLIKLNAIRDVLVSAIPDMQVAADPDSDCVELKTRDSETGKDKAVIFYRVRNSKGDIAGYAIKTAAFAGYSGKISMMIGVSAQGKVTGTCILEQKETPGLGTKIKEPSFKDQFTGIFRNNRDIKIKKFGGSIESVTGASVSSHAFTAALNEALMLFEEKIREKKP